MGGVKFQRVMVTAWEKPSDSFKVDLKKWEIDYIVGQEEMCPTTKKKHYQLYVKYSKGISMKYVKECFGNKAHIEIAKGTDEECIKYCTKEESRTGNWTIEAGELKTKGQRSDLSRVKEIIKEGGNMRDICEEASNYQALKGGELLLKYMETERDWMPEISWFYGETGTGKTKTAMEIFSEKKERWISGRNLKWWDGYDGHKDVIIDDFRADFCTFHELLRILDRTPFRIENKGGTRQLLAKRIIITSCYHPADVYNTREDIGQLLRRITTIKEFKKAEEVGGNTKAPTYENKDNFDDFDN